MQSYLNIRFESIEKRFEEIDLLINLAAENITDTKKYQTFCRSAHVLLVSHFEGIYKDVVKDIIDDFNANTNYNEIPGVILNTHFNYFLQTTDNSKSTKIIKDKLKDAFGNNSTKLRVEPFLFTDNRNPMPDIINTILDNFGISNFFWAIKDSDLDIVFENLKTETNKLRVSLLSYLKINTYSFPYSVECNIYNPVPPTSEKKKKTLWEDFLNEFLKERHSIIHGNILTSPFNHQAIMDAKTKIEIIIYAFIINLSSLKPLATT